MSNNFHEPIVTGESNSPSTINTRLSGLDNGISTLADALQTIIVDDGDSSVEVLAARTAINYAGGTPPATLATALAYAAGGVYNVLAYGAAGNGSTDDTAAIQDALDAADSAGGGVVLLPKGTYRITSALDIPSYVTLRGVGPKSLIDWQGTLSTNAISVGTSTDVTLEHFKLQNTSAVAASYGIYGADGSERVTVRGVQIVGANFSTAISSVSGNGTTVTVVTTGAHGLSTANKVWILNATGYTGQYDSITVTNTTTFTATATNNAGTINTGTVRRIYWASAIALGGENCTVEDCHIEAGIYVAVRWLPTATRCRATRNTVNNTMRAFMFDNGSTHNTVDFNVATTCHHIFCKIEDSAPYNAVLHNIANDCSNGAAETTGTLITTAPFTTFEGNRMFFSGTVLSTAAIYVHSDALYTTVRDNIIKDHSTYGIELRAGSGYVNVTGNHVSGGVHGIKFGAGDNTGTMIVGNHVRDVTGHGIFAVGSVSGSANFVIMNNVIRNVGVHGILIQGSATNGTIVGNSIRECAQAGILLFDSSAACSYIAIVGNTIHDVDNADTATFASTAHIGLHDNQDRIAVVGNVCNDTLSGTSSIRGSATTNSTIVGNVTSAGVAAASTGTVIDVNV
jgi:parallel beta-helix repeat protein